MLLVVQLQMRKQPEEEQRTAEEKAVLYMKCQKILCQLRVDGWVSGPGGLFAHEAMEEQEGGMGAFHWGETAATTAETYQNSSYILAQSL